MDKNDNSSSSQKKANNQVTMKPSKSDSLIDPSKEPYKLHYDSYVIDTHNDILMQVMEKGIDLTQEQIITQSDLRRMKKGGLDVQVFSIYVPEKYKSGHYNYVMREIDKLEEIAASNPDVLSLAYDYDGLIKLLKEGKTCGLLGGEGGTMIEGSLEKLENLYNRGLRYLTLTWNNSNQIGSSARDETERGVKGGLTEFGKKVVEKMDDMGMFIDVSHVGEHCFWDVINTSKNPVIASHSCVYNLSGHYRNLKDDQIQAIAKTGGVVFINFYSKFLDPNARPSETYHQRYKKELDAIENESGGDLIKFNKERQKFFDSHPSNSGTPIDVLIDHIDYIVKLVGADYVGLGSDFDGEVYTPNELYDASCYPVITRKLADRGYSEQDIRKILGLNFLRIFKKISSK